MDEAGEVDGAAIVAGGEAAEVLELAEAPLDAVALPVDGDVMRDDDFAAAVGGDHRFGADTSDARAQSIAA